MSILIILLKQFWEVKHLWGMPPKNSGGSNKFPGGHKDKYLLIGLPKQPWLELSPPLVLYGLLHGHL